MRLSATQRLATAQPSIVRRLIGYFSAALRWPFVHRYASPIWLAVRVYLGWTWLQVGLGQVNSGWLTSDPIGLMFTQIVEGKIAVPLLFYRDVASMLLAGGISPLISHSMPIAQIAVALAFFSGVLVVPAAIGAILLNLNIILSGIGLIALDGQFIMLQLLLILAWRSASRLGVERLLVRGGAALWRARKLGFGRGTVSVHAVEASASLMGEIGIADQVLLLAPTRMATRRRASVAPPVLSYRRVVRR